MANAHVHAVSSARKFGGTPEDYMALHEKMDCSKGYISDNRHRALTHNMFWIKEVMIPIFGYMIKRASDGKEVCTKDICEFHILEDFGLRFIPTAQDYIENMDFKDWMQNGMSDSPSSVKKIENKRPDRDDYDGLRRVLD
jgi:hypothetical protein